jgi:sugar phosphate isomerase/epimerase
MDLKIGLQLYSVKDELEKNFITTLKKVKEIGYDYVEFAGYFGKTAKEINKILDEIDLKCVSVHQNYDIFLNNAEREIEIIKILGAKYVAIPWMGVENHAGTKEYDNRIEEITKVGKLLKENNLQLLYHNHEFEFEKVNGEFKLDILYNRIPKEYLMTEIDTCWVKYAGYDPSKYLLQYLGRCPVVHLKDFTTVDLIDKEGKETKNNKEANGFKFKPLGEGVQDFKSIIKAAEKAQSKYLIVEQDSSPEMPALKSVEISRKYLKSLGL